MLLDTVAEPILGVSAEVLLNGSLEEVYTSCNFTFILWVAFVVFNVVFISIQVEDPEDLPDQVTALIGKTFKFGVYVNKDNVDYGSHIFNVGKTWSADTIITRADDEDTGDTSTIVSSDRSPGQVCKICDVFILYNKHICYGCLFNILNLFFCIRCLLSALNLKTTHVYLQLHCQNEKEAVMKLMTFLLLQRNNALR